MQYLCKQARTWAMKFKLLLLFGGTLMVMCFAYACGLNESSSWRCTVTLTLRPATIGNLSSPSGSGSGSGTGATQEEALRAALRTACSQLNLNSDLRSRCESGQDFEVAVTSGGITLISRVVRSSQNCSGSYSY